MKTLQEITKKLMLTRAELSKLESAYKANREALAKKIDGTKAELRMVNKGLDVSIINLAERVCMFEGDPSKTLSREKLIQLAMDDIATGCSHLKKEYFGIKNYSGFGDQRSDHPYGYGPRHGSIVFRVGLKDEKKELSEQEIEACLYYLLNWPEIYKQKKAA